MHQNGCPWDQYAAINAAKFGYLDILKYLHQNGCPWNELAFKTSSLEVVQYLYQNGCPWSQSIWYYLVVDRYLEIIKYLYENGFPCNENECLDVALVYNYYDIVDYFREKMLQTSNQ